MCSSTARLQEQQGLGLGLVIAKRLAELHGGSLSIDGRKDAGTTVIIKLPKAKADRTCSKRQPRVKPDRVRVPPVPRQKKS